MSARAVWPAALLLLTAATAREVVRLGYFTEAQPFEVACARGWFEAADLEIEVVCLPQSAGVGAVSKIDDGDLEISLLGSTPAAAAIARGVKLRNYYIAHLDADAKAPAGQLAAADVRVLEPPRRKCIIVSYSSFTHMRTRRGLSLIHI